MKKSINYAMLIALFAIILGTQSSCDKGLLPKISFKTGTGYTAANATVAKGAKVKVGIDAAKSEDADVLKTFNVSYKYDGAANPTTSKTDNLTGTQGDSYSTDVDITARNQAGTETWIFTVTNRDGLINSIELTLTVQ
jgi:hypothetical protein